MTPTEYEYARSALCNAYFSGIEFEEMLDVLHDESIKTCKEFDEKINLLVEYQCKQLGDY